MNIYRDGLDISIQRLISSCRQNCELRLPNCTTLINQAEEAMLRPAHAQPCATLRLPFALHRPPAQCGAAQQPGLKRLKIIIEEYLSIYHALTHSTHLSRSHASHVLTFSRMTHTSHVLTSLTFSRLSRAHTSHCLTVLPSYT